MKRRGVALFIALVTISIILAMGISILNITLKDFQLSSTARESEMAFSAADAGMECAMYWNQSNQGGKFSSGGNPISCMGMLTNTGGVLGATSRFAVTWGSSIQLCSIVDVTRYNAATVPSGLPACPIGICTQIISRGYNKACASGDAPPTDPHAVERALRSYSYTP